MDERVLVDLRQMRGSTVLSNEPGVGGKDFRQGLARLNESAGVNKVAGCCQLNNTQAMSGKHGPVVEPA